MLKKTFYVNFLFLILFLFNAKASESVLSLSLSGFYSSQRIHRGAQFWPGPAAMAGVEVALYDLFRIRGPSLAISPNRKDRSWWWAVGFYPVDDNKPLLPLSDDKEDFRNQRQQTFESSFTLGRFFGERKKLGFLINFYHDLDKTKSNFYEFNFQCPVLPFTTMSYGIGFGEKNSNTYLYGTGANSGVSYHDLKLKVVIPFVPWKGMVMMEGMHSRILQGTNRQASYVRGEDSHFKLMLMAVWNFYQN